jgi:hypothetical protein
MPALIKVRTETPCADCPKSAALVANGPHADKGSTTVKLRAD